LTHILSVSIQNAGRLQKTLRRFPDKETQTAYIEEIA
jgi:hypothetical protein